MAGSGYSQTPLIKKLGVPDDGSSLFINAPDEYFDVLGTLHPTASLPHDTADFIHAFFMHRSDVVQLAPLILSQIPLKGMLWVSWPKKSQKVIVTDLSEQDFRDIFLPHGLVDVKVCAISDVWSALKFVWRKNTHVSRPVPALQK